MVSHMKTTVVLPDDLFAALKRQASSRGVTVKSLVETAIRRSLEADSSPAPPFRLRKRVVDGSGVSAEFAGADWADVRRVIYEGRGE